MTASFARSMSGRADVDAGTRRAGWLPVRTQASARRRLIRPRLSVTAGGSLPRATNILAVTARPGQESADLGGLLHAFRRTGGSLGLLCLTRGEASPLNTTCEPLETLRSWELQVAAGILGVSSVALADFPDGSLSKHPEAALTERVRRAIRANTADLVLVIDPAPGDRDAAAVARAACSAARQDGVPAIARSLPGAPGSWPVDLGAAAAATRAIQESAAAAHASQAAGLPRVLRRLGLLGGQEHLRWLVPRSERQRGQISPRNALRAPLLQPAGTGRSVRAEAV